MEKKGGTIGEKKTSFSEKTPKEIFSEPLNEEEVIRPFKDKSENLVYYKKHLSPEYTYQVYKYSSLFKFLIEPSGPSYNTAELIFAQEGKELNLKHRLVNSKEVLGISGSDFLLKAEEYFKILRNFNEIKENMVGIEVGQPEVLKWALKNNFTFKDEKQRVLYESILSGRNNDYIEMNQGNLEDKDSRAPFWIKKDGLEDEKFQKCIRTLEDKSSFVQNSMDYVLANFPQYFLRFKLLKNL